MVLALLLLPWSDVVLRSDETDDSPQSLQELVDSCSEFISGDPTEYYEWLLSKGLTTIDDVLVETIQNEDILKNGNGDVGIVPGLERKFSSAVAAAVRSTSKVDMEEQANEIRMLR